MVSALAAALQSSVAQKNLVNGDNWHMWLLSGTFIKIYLQFQTFMNIDGDA